MFQAVSVPNKPMSFDALHAAVETYEADCTDAVANLHEMNFGLERQLVFTAKDSIAGVQAGLAPWAFDQACNRLNAPAAWLAGPDCPDQLRADILQQLAHVYRPDTPMLLRLKDNLVRAFLSEKYSIFDHLDLLDLVGQAVDQMGMKAQVHRAQVDDEMRAYIAFPEITFAPDPEAERRASHGYGNGGLHPALYISNSERGGGCARVCGAVYRYICSNGLIMGWKAADRFEERHIGHSKPVMGVVVAEAIAVSLQMSEAATKRFIESQTVVVPQTRIAGIVNAWAERYGITVDARDNWLAAVGAEATAYGRAQEPRLFDLVNAATYVSQGLVSADETENMERMAGQLLESYSLRDASWLPDRREN